MNYSDIGERKKLILNFIIDEYLNSYSPVGSRTISKNSKLGVSAATIRNEMSDLEDLGLLEKAHSSSGRIPSKLAYRYHVDSILNHFNTEQTNNKSTSLTVVNDTSNINSNTVLNLACDILSESTNSVIISSLERFTLPKLRKVEIINVNTDTYVIVSVLDNLEVSSKVFNVDFVISNSELKKLNFLINRLLNTNYMSNITKKEFDEFTTSTNHKDLMKYFLFLIKSEYCSINDVKTKVTGITNILDMPEYNSISELRSFLSFLDNPNNIKSVLNKETQNHINVYIGDEIGHEELLENSLVLSELILDNSYKIKLGVLSPIRSNYEKIISSLYNISWKLKSL